MASTYPTSIDDFTNPATTSKMDVISHSGQHSDINDAVEALEAKVGADSSAVNTTHDYKLSGVSDGDKSVSLTGTETLTNKTLTSPVLNTGVSGTAVLDEDNMASNSATQLATQQSIKAYADSKVDTTTKTGILKGNGSAISAAVSGTDYQGVLAEGAFVDGDKTKLNGIETGAEVNNISDINATDLTDSGATTLHKHSYNNLDDLPAIPTQYTDEMAQDAVGGMIDTTLKYTDATPLLTVTNPVVAAATGFTITAGTIEKTLTVSDTASVTGTNTGDETTSTIKTKLGAATAASDGYATSTQITKLDGIEASADVTDETNVKAALSGATITNATIVADDKVLFLDANDSDNLKQDDAQTLANLATPEGTAIKSTGEAGGSKFLREDGDGTCSWISIPGGGDMLSTNNLSDVAVAATAFSNIKQAATDAATGVVELATTAETTTGTDATRAVTPDGLHDMTSLAGAAWFLDEDNMASDSATKVASQQSIKAYISSAISSAWLAALPVGATWNGGTNSANPSTYLPGHSASTWVADSAGKVQVGLDSTDTAFDTADETGGAKTHTLDITEMPTHSHISLSYLSDTGSGAAGLLRANVAAGDVSYNTGAGTTNERGSSAAHNNLQPYIVKYMWKRTA
jgi:hypothetical protein